MTRAKKAAARTAEIDAAIVTAKMGPSQKPFRGRIGGWRRFFVSPGKFVIIGNIYGNPDHEHGAGIRTSLVVKKEGQLIETLNSRYRLVGK